MALHPYLFFDGNCREALTRYQEILGGDLVLLTRRDVPSDEPPDDDQADQIAHAALTFDGNLLMASDDPTDGAGPVRGMMVSYEVPDAAGVHRVFGALADGGTVTMPVEATFWSPAFGMCVDRFGVPWMVGAAEAS